MDRGISTWRQVRTLPLRHFTCNCVNSLFTYFTMSRGLEDNLNAGIGVESTGHCHPRVVKAIQEQAALLIHAQQNIFTSNVAQVESRLYHRAHQHSIYLSFDAYAIICGWMSGIILYY